MCGGGGGREEGQKVGCFICMRLGGVQGERDLEWRRGDVGARRRDES